MKRVFEVSIAVEGLSDEAVVRRIVRDHGMRVKNVFGLRGKHHLDQRLNAFNSAAKYGAWLVVRDLDHDAVCAAALARDRLPSPNSGMRFRIAVRALEAWLLADAEGIAAYFGVARHHVPHTPERISDPKAALIEVARRSRSRAIREDMLPSEGTTARVGPGFIARINEFASSDWSWERGAKRSESLGRCVKSVAAWK
jgi:hypothetical protein